jgi:hypothetical protein
MSQSCHRHRTVVDIRYVRVLRDRPRFARRTTSKLSALSQCLGYGRPECIPGTIRRVETWTQRNAPIEGEILALEKALDVFNVRATPEALNAAQETENEANEKIW